MKRVCDIAGTEFEISPQEMEFCKKEEIPLPTTSPHERLRHMLYFRNRMHLYRTKCSMSGKEIFSSVPVEAGIPVYESAVWESDDWDAADYAKDYDFSKPFFEQFHELYVKVPRPNTGSTVASLENCEYTNGIARSKNCYLLFSSHNAEDCYFSKAVYRVKNIVDSLLVYDSEICYDCQNVKESYNLIGSQHSVNCKDSAFLFNCTGCSNCFGCVNLSQKQFCFFNEQLTKDQYLKKLADIDLGSFSQYEAMKIRFNEFCKSFPIKFYFGSQNEESTGNFINNTKNCKNSYFVSKAEDVENSIYLETATNSMIHVNFGGKAELTYNCISVGDNSYNVKFSGDTWLNVRDIEYSYNVRNGAHDCFGCVGIKRKAYCILNKEYSKSEYFELLPRIKRHMISTGEYGKFFPISSSPNCYNRSDVEEFFPLSRDEALNRGFNWHDEGSVAPKIAAEIPDNIKNFSESDLSKVYQCKESGKDYKITKAELDFYKRYNLPVPRVAPLERLRNRCKNFFQVKSLSDGNCNRCGQSFLTCQDQSSGQVILCETCFQKEVF